MISTRDLEHKISEYFTWKEVLHLREWNIYAVPTEKDWLNLKALCNRADIVRKMIGSPMEVTSCYRPPAYNRHIGGAYQSWHRYGMAMDFRVPGQLCDDIRNFLKPHLEDIQIRVENLPGSAWVHFDIAPPSISGRFFTP